MTEMSNLFYPLEAKKAEILGENSEHCCISSISTGFQWTCSEVKMFPLFTFDWLLMEYCYTARCIGPSVVQEPIKSLEGVSTWWSWQFNKRRNTDMKCSFRHFASFLKGRQVTKDSCGLADGCVGKKTNTFGKLSICEPQQILHSHTKSVSHPPSSSASCRTTT